MGKIGLQLYTVREETAKDFLGTIQKVAKTGYQGVEFAGYYGTPARRLKETLDGAGLVVAGTTVQWPVLEMGLEASIEYCRLIDCPAIICPWIDESTRQSLDDFKKIVDRFHYFGAKCAENGMRFLHHIHGFEFAQVSGTCLMDYMLEHCDPKLVNFEIDVYWVEHAGVDSVQFMEKHAGRCPYIHFKDTKDKQNFRDTEIGEGAIDMPSIMRLGKAHQAEWFIVEQEAFDIPPMQSIEISLKNLKKMDAKP
jgi:sugar phosphate isomerase/epimerase